MPNHEDEFKVTKKELLFLVALLGEEEIIGIENPFFGYLEDQLKHEWYVCCNEMLLKGIITSDDNKFLHVPKQIENTVRICCSPEIRILIVEKDPPRMVHINGKLNDNILVVLEDNNTEVALETLLLGEQGSLSDVIIKAMGISDRIKGIDTSIILQEKTFEEALALSGDGEYEKAKSIIETSFAVPDVFVHALARPEKSIILSRITQQAVKTAGLYMNESCMVMVTPAGRDHELYQAAAVDAGQVRSQISTLFKEVAKRTGHE